MKPFNSFAETMRQLNGKTVKRIILVGRTLDDWPETLKNLRMHYSAEDVSVVETESGADIYYKGQPTGKFYMKVNRQKIAFGVFTKRSSDYMFTENDVPSYGNCKAKDATLVPGGFINNLSNGDKILYTLV